MKKLLNFLLTIVAAATFANFAKADDTATTNSFPDITEEQINQIRSALLSHGSQDSVVGEILALQNIEPITLDNASGETQFIKYEDFVTFFGFWRVQYAVELDAHTAMIEALVNLMDEKQDEVDQLREDLATLTARVNDLELEVFYDGFAYEITFKIDEEDEDPYIALTPSNSVPIPPTVTLEKEGFVFNGWMPELVEAVSNTTYTAVWAPTNGAFGVKMSPVPLAASSEDVAADIVSYMENLQSTNEKIDRLNTEKIQYSTDTISVDGETVLTVLTPPASEGH